MVLGGEDKWKVEVVQEREERIHMVGSWRVTERVSEW